MKIIIILFKMAQRVSIKFNRTLYSFKINLHIQNYNTKILIKNKNDIQYF
jgi:hypothetical protein